MKSFIRKGAKSVINVQELAANMANSQMNTSAMTHSFGQPQHTRASIDAANISVPSTTDQTQNINRGGAVEEIKQ